MKTIILHFTEEDRSYLPVVKPLLAAHAQVYLDNTVPAAGMEMVIKSKSRGDCAIVSTSQKLLSLLMDHVKSPRIDDYAGSFFEWRGTWFLFVNPLQQLVSTPTGKFIFSRFVDKILHPEKWIGLPSFKWEIFQPSRMEYLYNFFESCTLIATDIETRVGDPDRTITCIGFCGIRIDRSQISLVTVVVPFQDMYSVLFARLILSNQVAKVLQNGKYDIAYLLRYGCPVSNYSFDTINLFHSWLSELPKDLGFISSFMLREYVFHKNDGSTGNIIDYYEYNAKDCYTTLFTCLALLEIPEYAANNFLPEFPLVFPCILSEHTGIKWDQPRADSLLLRVEKDMEDEKKRLQTMVACPTFNPNSSQQTVRLFALLGSKDVTSSTPPDKDKVSTRHPLNARILSDIVSYRENMKLRSSYFKTGISWNGICFYALNPHGTDTGRLASRESQFWCGLQIQNIPRDGDEGDISVKEAFVAYDDFYFGEADFAQNETRGTAYLSGDTALLEAVDDVTKDFHGINASKFFGVPYEKIVSSSYNEEIEEWVHKTLDKVLRNEIGKRINHGANYNMGPQVMVDTMGIRKVLLAKELLGLPRHWSPFQVCEYLLAQFTKTYHIMKGPFYDSIINSVTSSGFLVGPTGWTRRCFGTPKKSKRDLNRYVAHPPQSLAAMVLNTAYMNVFKNVYLPNPTNFKLCAQIHDSILFQYRRGHEYLAYQVAQEMKITVQVRDTFGIVRPLTVPVDLKGEAARWSDVTPMKKLREERKAA